MAAKKTKAEHASTITAWAALLASFAGLFQTVWTTKPWWAEDKAPVAIEAPAEDAGKVASTEPPPMPADFEMPPPEDFPEITQKTIMVQGPQQWGKGSASQPQTVHEWPEGWDRKRVWNELVTKMPAAADSAGTTEVAQAQEEHVGLPVGPVIMVTGISLALLAFAVSRYLRKRRERHGTGGMAC